MLRFVSLVWERIIHPRVPCEMSSHELLPSRRKMNGRPFCKGFVTYSQINTNRLSFLKLYLFIRVVGAGWEGTGTVSTMALYKSQRKTCREGSPLSFQHVDFRGQTQVIRNVDNHVVLLRCLHSPQILFKMSS